MFARVTTVAFEGIEARLIDVQVQIGPGMPAFTIAGLPTRLWPRAGRGCAAR
jgi:magnesium chelatase family protein